MNKKNPNHPKKRDKITVDPIRDTSHVKAIRKMLADNPRDHLLFVMGVNNGLRVGDLLKLKVGQVRGLKRAACVEIFEGKTGKRNVLVINGLVEKALKHYFAQMDVDDNAYLFASRKGQNRPITIQTVNRLIKQWTKAINLKGNYGAHSLRKTWGYLQRTKKGVGFEIIAKRFNHSSPSVTMRYLGIQSKEVYDVLMNNIG